MSRRPVLRPARSSLLIAALLLIGCETSFEPYERNEFYYSVFGYLDSSAETQFIRVSPLRNYVRAETGTLDAEVSLEHVGTGRRTVWRDSLFRFADGRLVHNFYSTERVEAGQTYRFTVRRSDGAETSTLVRLPDPAPPPRLVTGLKNEGNTPPVTQNITLPGVKRLADLRIVYYLPTPVEISYIDRVQVYPDSITVGFNAFRDLTEELGLLTCPLPQRVEVVVGVAGPEWPEFFKMDEETRALIGLSQESSIRNGVGFVGGITSARYSWPEVIPAIELNGEYCR